MSILNKYFGFVANTASNPIIWGTDNVRVLLANSSYTPNAVSDVFITAANPYEVSGNNYTSNGTALANVTVVQANGVASVQAANPVWAQSSAGFPNARFAVLYKSTGNTANSPLIGWIDFGVDANSQNSFVEVQWAASGIVQYLVDDYAIANAAFSQANAAFNQANTAYAKANAAANTVATLHNGTLVLASANLNVNDSQTVNATVTANGTGQANVAFNVNTSALPFPQDYVLATNYVTAQHNTGGVNHGASSKNGNNIITLAPGPFVFTNAMVGSNIYVGGVGSMTIGAGAYITSYLNPQQVKVSVNATSTQTITSCVVFNAGQDDTTGILAALAAAGSSQSKVYFPARVYVYNQEFDLSGLQGLIGDGVNRTFFIPKANTQTGGFLNVSNMPAGFQLGGIGQGFSAFGPIHKVPVHQANLSIANGIITCNVDTGSMPTVNAIYKLLGARGTASTYNETYWKVQTSNSTSNTWTGTPYYVDQTSAIGNVSAVSVTSNVLTVLEDNPNRKVSYVTYFNGLANATFLNGTSGTVESIVYNGNAVIGYTYALTHADYANTADTGVVSNFANTGSAVVDNFASIPDWNGVRISTNVFPPGSNILIFPTIYEVFVTNFSGAGFRFVTPNFGYAGKLSAVGCNEGFAIEGYHPSTGFWSNPSCFEFGHGMEFESCTLVGFSMRDNGGMQTGMIGGGSSGIGVLCYDCDGTVITSFDLETLTPWSVDPTMYPGHNIEIRGSNAVEVHAGYLSFNSSNAQIGVYMWDSSQACKYYGSRHFLAGGYVQPNNEVYIDSSCIDCAVEETNYNNSSAWTNLSTTSRVYGEGGNRYFGGNVNIGNIANTSKLVVARTGSGANAGITDLLIEDTSGATLGYFNPGFANIASGGPLGEDIFYGMDSNGNRQKYAERKIFVVSNTANAIISEYTILTAVGNTLYNAIVANGANVGLGTTNPQANLHVVGNILVSTTANVTGQVNAASIALTGNANVGSTLNVGGAAFVTGNTQLSQNATIGGNLQVTNGNVGIGTASLDSQLRVFGANGSGLRIGYNGQQNYYDAQQHIFRDQNAGNTVLSINAVSQNVAVTGNLNVSGFVNVSTLNVGTILANVTISQQTANGDAGFSLLSGGTGGGGNTNAAFTIAGSSNGSKVGYTLQARSVDSSLHLLNPSNSTVLTVNSIGVITACANIVVQAAANTDANLFLDATTNGGTGGGGYANCFIRLQYSSNGVINNFSLKANAAANSLDVLFNGSNIGHWANNGDLYVGYSGTRNLNAGAVIATTLNLSQNIVSVATGANVPLGILSGNTSNVSIVTNANGTVSIDTSGSGGGGIPGGANTQVQFDNNGVFGGSPNLTFNVATNVFTIGANTLAVSAASGNVGVGQGSPQTALDVNGIARANTHQDHWDNVGIVTTTTNIDCRMGTYQDITLAGNITLYLQNCATAGNVSIVTLYVRQSHNGSNTVTWGNTTRWSDNNVPVLSTAGNTADEFTFTTFNGGTIWYGRQTMGNVPFANTY